MINIAVADKNSSDNERPYCLVISLVYDDQLGYLAEPFYAQLDKNGQPDFVIQTANIETYSTFLSEKDTSAYLLINEHVKNIQIDKLVQKFNPKKEKKTTWKKLTEDKKILDLILKYKETQFHHILSVAKLNNILLIPNAKRKEFIGQNILLFTDKALDFSFYFGKKEEGIDYRLTIVDENHETIKISDIQPQVLNNEFCWFISKGLIYYINAFSGNLLKPFIDKDLVFIPQKHAAIWMKSFLVKISSRTDVSTDGFEIKTNDTLTRTTLEIKENTFTGELGIIPVFHYNKVAFALDDIKKNKHHLQISPDHKDVIVTKTQRNTSEENKVIAALAKSGFASGTNRYLETSDPITDPDTILLWARKNQKTLAKAGIEVDHILFDRKPLSTSDYQVKFTEELKMDWFEIHINILIGIYEIPFHKLKNNIIERNHFYPLPDNSFFYIPSEWFEKYEPLIRDNDNTNTIRIHKSKYGLLYDILNIKQDQSELKTRKDLKEWTVSPLIKTKLRPYQEEGVKWMVSLYQRGLGGCLADDMGLGKTIQTITLLAYIFENRPMPDAKTKPAAKAVKPDLFNTGADKAGASYPFALIVAPATLILNWQNELNQFLPDLKYYIHHGAKRAESIATISGYDIIITSYQTAQRDVDLFKEINFECLVLDESQHIRNRDSLSYKAVCQLSAYFKLALTGTPIATSLSNLWPLMNISNPHLLGTYDKFKSWYQIPIEKNGNEAILAEFRKLIDPYILRRTKEEVLKDLPEKFVYTIYTEMTESQSKIYEEEKSRIRNQILEITGSGVPVHIFNSLMKLRQIAIHPKLAFPDFKESSGKMDIILDHISSIVESGHKVLVFSQFVSVLDIIAHQLDTEKIKYQKLIGELSLKQRQKSIDVFQNTEDSPVFLITLKAGSEGLNLTAADYVFIVDPWWNPSVEKQAIDRVHRIGRQDKVFAYKFITKGTLEEKILMLQEKRKELAKIVIDQELTGKFSKDDVLEIL